VADAIAAPPIPTLDAVPPQNPLPAPLYWQSAAAWLLENELTAI